MVAEEEQSKPKRRIRRVETVREKSEKSQKQQEKPSKIRLVWHGFTAPLRFVGRGIRAVGRALAKFKVFRAIGRVLWPYYFRNSWKELRQVTWTKWKQSRQLTLAVLLFSIVFGVLIAGVDFGLDKVFKEVLLK